MTEDANIEDISEEDIGHILSIISDRWILQTGRDSQEMDLLVNNLFVVSSS